MNHADLLQLATEIAFDAHKGQRDKQGEPYIFHVMRVALACEGEARIVALLHDVVEDCEDWSVERLREKGVPDHIAFAVDVLTRRPPWDYAPYILAVAKNDLARLVKLADIRDHLTNPGSMSAAYANRARRSLQQLQTPPHTLTSGGPMSDALKSQIADVIEKHVGYTNGWAVSPDTYRIAAEEAAAEILTLAATKAAHPEGGPASAGVIAWLVQGHTPARTVTLDERAAEAYRATEGFTVTPLIAAPPAGAPTYTELVAMLREWDADCAERVAAYGDGEDNLRPYQRYLFDSTRDLLSRIPKVENADGQAG
jgi:hypothetical protein